MIGGYTIPVVVGVLLFADIVRRVRRNDRLIRWAFEDEVETPRFIAAIRAVRPGAIIAASVAPPRTVPEPPKPTVVAAPPRLRLVDIGEVL